MVSTAGLVDAWTRVDTPAWFGRDLARFPAVLACLQSQPSLIPWKAQVEVLYPTDFAPAENKAQMQELENFLDDLGKLDNCKCRKTSIADDWCETSSVDEKDLQKYLYHVRSLAGASDEYPY